jgi:hypothetical protein
LPPLFIESHAPGSASVVHTSMMRADDVICRFDDLGLPQLLSDPRAKCISRDPFNHIMHLFG